MCQAEECVETTLKAAEETVEVSLSEFGGSIDVDKAGILGVVVSRATTVLAEASEPLAFSDWEPERGCGTYGEHVIDIA